MFYPTEKHFTSNGNVVGVAFWYASCCDIYDPPDQHDVHNDMFKFNQSHRQVWQTFELVVSHETVFSDLYLSAHVDWYAHNDDWDGDARYKGDDHRRPEQHAHLPQNLASL